MSPDLGGGSDACALRLHPRPTKAADSADVMAVLEHAGLILFVFRLSSAIVETLRVAGPHPRRPFSKIVSTMRLGGCISPFPRTAKACRFMRVLFASYSNSMLLFLSRWLFNDTRIPMIVWVARQCGCYEDFVTLTRRDHLPSGNNAV